MYPLGHMVSDTSSTVTNWCFPRTTADDADDIARVVRANMTTRRLAIYFLSTVSCVCPGGNANPSTASEKRTTTLSGVISALLTPTSALMTALATSLRTSGVLHALGNHAMCTKGMYRRPDDV